MFGQTIRRFYRTKAGSSIPKGAQVARTQSTPLAVRERRERKLGKLEPGETDATYGGLTPTELARYRRFQALGTLPNVDGKPITETQFLQRLVARRSRIRGTKVVKRENGEEQLEVVGQPVYLPNIVFRLVRNFTPEGQDYNPYEATFRVPLSITKNDIRSYLLAVYGVQTTYVRTDIYYPKHLHPLQLKTQKKRSAYKRAVVGLVDPFYYPHRLEDMPLEEREERENFIEQQFRVAESETQKDRALVHQNRRDEGLEVMDPNGKMLKARRWKILQAVMQRRRVKQDLIIDQVQEWQQKREKGEEIRLIAQKTTPAEAVTNTSTTA
ncbi:mitochondrial ribosomal protein subunit l23 [Moniliophthora roreri MCA 2997]|uniref:Large ribosomal subunit protein uL23m n=1 Tax=Moniliophthora roreri (strain MCA 2997) TaxID=1381753 RepID=V2XQN5_MONRO|nr:mitochondrial ribosomal protein subunit l23 [Moniliophthora roreri MCA 2997]KAI3619921.1 mitochondrial ribosomal protein subunit l23 [Moniliophthora roreri]